MRLIELEPCPRVVEAARRSPEDREEVARRVALYQDRAARGLDIFSGKPLLRRREARRNRVNSSVSIYSAPFSRGVVHKCGNDLWRKYARGINCVPCVAKQAREWKESLGAPNRRPYVPGPRSCARTILDALRENRAPMRSSEIAELVQRAHPGGSRTMYSSSLEILTRAGLVRSAGRAMWEAVHRGRSGRRRLWGTRRADSRGTRSMRRAVAWTAGSAWKRPSSRED